MNLKYSHIIAELSLMILAAFTALLHVIWPGMSWFLQALPIVLFAVIVYLLVSRRSQVLILWVLLVIFFGFPYSSVNPSVRAEGNYFTIYLRNFGLLSTWDVLIILSLAALLLRRWLSGRFRFNYQMNQTLLAIFIFYLFAFLLGLFHVHGNFLSYGATGILRPFVSLQPVIYMGVLFVITVSTIQTKNDLEKTVTFYRWLTIALIVYGIVRAVLIFTGEVETMWPFGLPIILYDQLMMLFVPIFWGIIAYFSRGKKMRLSLFWVLMAVIFVITSARRFNYLLLFFGIIFSLLFFYKTNTNSFRKLITRIAPVGFTLIALTVIILFTAPDVIENIGKTLESLDIRKSSVPNSGADIRRAELKNIFGNMKERPYSFFCGFGLGTVWKPIHYQPYDRYSFTKSTLVRTKGWIPQFHLPYISLIFRYGLAGVLIYWFLCVFLVFYFYQWLKSLHEVGLGISFYLAGLVFILLILPSIGDSVNPTAPILAGFYLGIIKRFIELNRNLITEYD